MAAVRIISVLLIVAAMLSSQFVASWVLRRGGRK